MKKKIIISILTIVGLATVIAIVKVNRSNSKPPQIFKTEVMTNCYKKIKKSNINFTDESEMVEKNGFNVQTFKMDENNIKITTKEDLKIFKALKVK